MMHIVCSISPRPSTAQGQEREYRCLPHRRGSAAAKTLLFMCGAVTVVFGLKFVVDSNAGYGGGMSSDGTLESLAVMASAAFSGNSGSSSRNAASRTVLPPVVTAAVPASQTANVGGAAAASTETAALSDAAVAVSKFGNYCFPLDGELTSVFAQREDPFGTGETEFHTGIDISAEKSTVIRASLSGTVERVAQSTGYGKYILLSHNGGVETLYAHCDKIYAKQGDKVSSGDVIAKAGSTGRSTGPHLHYEVRVNGTAVDPINWGKVFA